MSVAEIEYAIHKEAGKSKLGGLQDPRQGPIDKDKTCLTCAGTKFTCPGYEYYQCLVFQHQAGHVARLSLSIPSSSYNFFTDRGWWDEGVVSRSSCDWDPLVPWLIKFSNCNSHFVTQNGTYLCIIYYLTAGFKLLFSWL